MQTEQLMDLKGRTDKCVIVSSIRPGSQLFATKLEYEHYPPRTKANDKFDIGMFIWNELPVNLVVIPREDAHLAHKVAEELGLRLNNELVMTLLFDGKKEDFPLHGDHVFMMEGDYEGDEDAAVQAIFENDAPYRKKYIQSNIKVLIATKPYLDSWSETLKIYPILHGILVKTGPDLLKCFVAMIGDTPYGFITLCKDGPGTYVGMIWIEEHSRRCGLADFLLKATINYCVDHDLCKLRLESRSTILDKIIARIPSAFDEIVEITRLGDDLSVEQEQVGPRYAQS